MKVLGIETSCDETAAAVISDDRKIMSNLVLSQLDEHRVFGGVVPEVAARAHLDHLDTLIKGAMSDAGIGFDQLDGVAATCGPGLIGGVMVGMMAGKAIAAAHKLPFIAVNHLEAHALTPRLTDDLPFPYLLLLVSGGHSQILVAEDVGIYRHWGGTMDDALGECFDKSAKLMGLPYPGGPNLERAAQGCQSPSKALLRFDLPRPMKGRPELDFSFSGLKTAVRSYVDKLPAGALKREDVADLSYSFQEAICDVLQDRLSRAMEKFKLTYTLPPPAGGRGDTGGREISSIHSQPAPSNSPSRKQEGEDSRPALVLAGGVAANLRIREALTSLAAREGFRFVAPPVKLCSDNAAMIAWAGIEHLRLGHTHELNVAARPRWPLTEMEAEMTPEMKGTDT